MRTDADGRFTLTGIGRNRIADIQFRAPGIETTLQFARTRPGEVVALKTHGQFPEMGGVVRVYSSDADIVAGPSVPVEGRVTDFKTGEPVGGIEVQSRTGFFSRSITDSKGKYRLDGLPLGRTQAIIRPPPGSKYLGGAVIVATAAGPLVTVQDFTLKAGVIFRGRAIDERTGKGVPGRVEYFAYDTNPYLPGSDSLQRPYLRDAIPCDVDGRFEIAVLPGKGILGFNAGPEFPRGVGVDRIDCPRTDENGDAVEFRTAPKRCTASSLNLVVPLDPQPDDVELTADLTVRSGIEVRGVVLAPDGRPLGGCLIIDDGRTGKRDKIANGEFTITGYFPTERRRLTAFHAGQNLAGFYDLSGDRPEKVEIRIRPAATLIGRVLDVEGTPQELADIMSFEPRSGRNARRCNPYRLWNVGRIHPDRRAGPLPDQGNHPRIEVHGQSLGREQGRQQESS